ncbi:MAG: hypothetical protein OHK0039_49110 [Bacteroidia bacterium]
MTAEQDTSRSLYLGPDDPADNRPRTQHLLVIGIDTYTDPRIPNLKNARADAEAMVALLQERYRFDGRCKTLYDEEATRTQIIKALDEFLDDERQADDSLLIYFAGHGYHRKQSKKGYWVPADAVLGDYATLISNTTLLDDYLPHMPARHVVLIVDSCFSGALFRDIDFREERRDDQQIRKMLAGRSRLGIAAGSIELVADGLVGNHSPFSDSLLRILRENQQPNLPALDLFHPVSQMTTYRSDQRPVYGVLAKSAHDVGSQFVFQLIDDAERRWQHARTTNSVEAWLDYVRRYRLFDYEPELSRVAEALDHIGILVGRGDADPAVLRRLRGQIGALQADLARLSQENAALVAVQVQVSDRESAYQTQLADLLNRLKVATETATQMQYEKQQALVEIQTLRYERATLSQVRLFGEAYQRAARQAWEELFAHTSSLDELDRYLRWFPEGDYAVKAQALQAKLRQLRVPEMVRIEGGVFVMGSNEYDSEKPLHRVQVRDFYIGKHVLTVGEFRRFIESSGYQTDAEKQGSSQIWMGGKSEEMKGVDWRCDVGGKPRPLSEDRHPVIHVSRNDAQAYCAWLSKETGQAWRLPTEAEWEYAAGGGAGNRTKWAGTNDEKALGDYAWYDKNSGEQTHPVGEKKPNELGLYDMSGNVWEWCEDDWHGNYQGAPGDGKAWVESPKGSYRVLRGGGWPDFAQFCRAADRDRGTPYNRNAGVGFRLVFVP